MQTLTVWQFVEVMWRDTQPLGYITTGIWLILLIDFLGKVYRGKKTKGKEGHIIQPQRESLARFQPVYQATRLPQDTEKHHRWKLRNLWSSLSS